MAHRLWAFDETVLAFALYCQLPFGQLDSRNPRIRRLAAELGRTPGALAMKMNNIARLDPSLRARGIKGLTRGAKIETQVFARYWQDLDALAEQAVASASRLNVGPDVVIETAPPEGIPTIAPGEAGEEQRLVRVRRGQQLFRRVVLATYNARCAVCELSVARLLAAAHIVPWSIDAGLRADPTNGLALCALHHAAFDAGIVSVDDRNKVIVSRSIRNVERPVPLHRIGLLEIAGRELLRPARFLPSPEAFRLHRERVFVA